MCRSKAAAVLQEALPAPFWELRWQAAPGAAELLPPAVLPGILVNPEGATAGVPALTAPLAVGFACRLLHLELDLQPAVLGEQGAQLAEVACTGLQVLPSTMLSQAASEMAQARACLGHSRVSGQQ